MSLLDFLLPASAREMRLLRREFARVSDENVALRQDLSALRGWVSRHMEPEGAPTVRTLELEKWRPVALEVVQDIAFEPPREVTWVRESRYVRVGARRPPSERTPE